MNIFVLAKNPELAARMLCDQHVVKMSLESTQMLCCVYRQTVPNFLMVDCDLYKLTHRNHPCTIWAGLSADNYTWLALHAAELFREYTARYGGKRHASEPMFERVRVTPHALPRNGGNPTPFVQCMPDMYKGPNAVEAYRRYYVGEKLRIARWRRTEIPYWIPNPEDYRR